MNQSALKSAPFAWSSFRAVSSRTITHLYPIGAIFRSAVELVRIVTSFKAWRTPHRMAVASIHQVMSRAITVHTMDQTVSAKSSRCNAAAKICELISILPPVSDREDRNRNEWLSIADFLTRQNLRLVLAARAAEHGKRSACEAGALPAALALPSGNHGEISKVAKGQGI